MAWRLYVTALKVTTEVVENLNESLVIREALPGPERGNLFPQE